MRIYNLQLATTTTNGQGSDGGEGLVEILFTPFRVLVEILVDTLVTVLTHTPSIYPNPAVEQIHRLTLQVAFAVTGLVIAVAGVYYITGFYLGVSYRDVRMILPRLLLALGFSVVSLRLLQVGVRASDAFVEVFQPVSSIMVSELAGLSTSLVLVWFINAWLLLALVLLFVFRSVYLLLGAATSPLIAVAWSVPNTKRYADSFISAWFVLLAVAPIDVLILRFNLSLLETGASGLQQVSNWIFGVASFALMLWVPLQLYGVSQMVVGRASGIANEIGRTVGRRTGGTENSFDRERGQQRRRQRFRGDRYRREDW